MYIYFTVLAALLFGSAGYVMKLSEGLSRPIPTIGFCLMLVMGGLLMTFALQRATLGKTYVIISGLESITTILLAVVLLREEITGLRLLATIIVFTGVFILQVTD